MTRPFIPISHGIEVALKAHAAGRMSPAVMTFGFKAAADLPSDGDVAAVATFFGTWLGSQYAGIPADSVRFDEFIVKSLAQNPGPRLRVAVASNATGGTGRFAVFAPLTLLYSDNDGRSQNGRSFSFMPGDDNLGDLGEFDSIYIASVQSAQQALVTAAATALYPRAVPSTLLRTMTEVLTCITEVKYAYQTRRDPNRG